MNLPLEKPLKLLKITSFIVRFGLFKFSIKGIVKPSFSKYNSKSPIFTPTSTLTTLFSLSNVLV